MIVFILKPKPVKPAAGVQVGGGVTVVLLQPPGAPPPEPCIESEPFVILGLMVVLALPDTNSIGVIVTVAVALVVESALKQMSNNFVFAGKVTAEAPVQSNVALPAARLMLKLAADKPAKPKFFT